MHLQEKGTDKPPDRISHNTYPNLESFNCINFNYVSNASKVF
jgi:hypothetical protein